jgi:hypothetical protein
MPGATPRTGPQGAAHRSCLSLSLSPIESQSGAESDGEAATKGHQSLGLTLAVSGQLFERRSPRADPLRPATAPNTSSSVARSCFPACFLSRLILNSLRRTRSKPTDPTRSTRRTNPCQIRPLLLLCCCSPLLLLESQLDRRQIMERPDTLHVSARGHNRYMHLYYQ